MVSPILILALSVCVLVAAVLLLFRRREHEEFSIEDWERLKHEVDIEVFRAITHNDQEKYLAQSLNHREFARFQRKRIALALRIVELVDENVDMLMKLGRQARVSGDAIVVREADHLLMSTSYLRLNLILAKYCLRIKWIFPTWKGFVPPLQKPYQKMMDSFVFVHAQQYGVKRP